MGLLHETQNLDRQQGQDARRRVDKEPVDKAADASSPAMTETDRETPEAVPLRPQVFSPLSAAKASGAATGPVSFRSTPVACWERSDGFASNPVAGPVAPPEAAPRSLFNGISKGERIRRKASTLVVAGLVLEDPAQPRR